MFTLNYWLTYREAPLDKIVKNRFVCFFCRSGIMALVVFAWYHLALSMFQMGLCPYENVMISTGAVCCHAVFLTVLQESNKHRVFKLHSGGSGV